MKRLIACIVVVLFALVSSSESAAEIQTIRYAVQDLGTLGGSSSHPSGLSNQGHVVGLSSTGTEIHGFLFSNGQMTDLGVLSGHNQGRAAGVNDDGVAVGASEHDTTSLSLRPVRYSDGTITELGSLGGDYGFATGINNNGQIVGLSRLANGVTHAFLYSAGMMTDLGTPAPGVTYDYSCAYDINDLTQIAGVYTDAFMLDRGFIWENGVFTDLGDLSDGSGSTRAYRINNSGQVVGESSVVGSTVGHAFMWDNGVMLDLGVLPNGSESSLAEGINNNGVVVGTSYTGPTGSSSLHRAFIWTWEEGLRDVNSMLDSSSKDWIIAGAKDINDAGQIVGWGYTEFGEHRALLLTPTAVPEPTSLAIWSAIALGGLGLAYRRRRRQTA